MHWIEILQIRAAKQTEIEDLIERLNHSLERGGIEFAVYRRATIFNDLSIHLVHETNGDTRPNQTLGQRLAATLSDHGLVSHSLWVEMHPSDRR